MIFSIENKWAATLSDIGYRSDRPHRYYHLQSASAPHPRDCSASNDRPGCIARHPLVEQGVVSVRLGRWLLPKAGEMDARDAIELKFAVDNGNPILARGKSAPVPSTDRQYGPAKGELLIAKTLEDCNVPAAFSMLAPSAMLAAPMTPRITNSGKSEVALDGYIHEPVAVLDKGPEEKRPLNQPIDCSAKQTGKRPVGSRTAGWAVSKRTIGIDLLYDSSMASPTRPRMALCTRAPLSPPRRWRAPFLISANF
jgi:hypothetical protein